MLAFPKLVVLNNKTARSAR